MKDEPETDLVHPSAVLFLQMTISAKAEYACLAVLALAQHGADAAPLRIREISGAYGIPERYLVQILLQLKGAGLVASTRGASGGYRLARDASSISLNHILTAVDGPAVTRPRRSEAERPTASLLDTIWKDVRAAERAVLEGTTIAQLLDRCSPREWII
jgi:Rrf2 family transcriptional regulator, cysteine metabolism repressor